MAGNMSVAAGVISGADGVSESDDDSARAGPSLRRLRKQNLVVGTLHLVQAVAILALSNDFTIAITAAFAEGPPGTALPAASTVFDAPVGAAVALFLALAAVDHLLMAAPRVSAWYEAGLRRGVNYARWAEYSVSASLMLVLIAMLTGITDLFALIGVFTASAAMIGFGALMERVNQDRSPRTWWPFWFGSVAGAVPWIAIAIALAGAEAGEGSVPGFVYGIFVSLFIFYNSFAVNMFLQYRAIGRWRSYLFGEQAYIVLSLGAKSALAWQVFSGTLAA